MYLRVKLSVDTKKSRWYISGVQDSLLHGGVAQVVEQAAHIRWVRGSNPFAAIFLPTAIPAVSFRQLPEAGQIEDQAD
jgi:hypothetical protein